MYLMIVTKPSQHMRGSDFIVHEYADEDKLKEAIEGRTTLTDVRVFKATEMKVEKTVTLTAKSGGERRYLDR